MNNPAGPRLALGCRPVIAIVAAAVLATACSASGSPPTTTAPPPVTATSPTGAPSTTAATPAVPTTTLPPEPEPECIGSGDQTVIQAALDGPGAVALLCPDAVFELTASIEFTAPDQEIATRGSPVDGHRALLRIADPQIATAVNAHGLSGARLRHVIVDGARPEFGLADGGLLEFGGPASGQVVEWVRAFEPRGWSVLVVNEGHEHACRRATIRNNELGPAGRRAYGLADGISLACPDSVVTDNVITDATDGGIVIFGAPGSIIERNTIRAVERPLLYGIAMGDYGPFDGDFTGTTVRNNTIDAAGALISVGINIGDATGCITADTSELNRGGIVTGNVLTGEFMGYGLAASGVTGWTAIDNVDRSSHVPGDPIGAGCSGEDVTPPGSFIRTAFAEGTFQPEFEEGTLSFLLGVFPFEPVADQGCLSGLVGPDLVGAMRTAAPVPIWLGLEGADPRIGRCVSQYIPPELPAAPDGATPGVDYGVLVGWEECGDHCLQLKLWNLAEQDGVDLGAATFVLNSFLVGCDGLAEVLGPREETTCRVTEFLDTHDLNVLTWYGFASAGDPGIVFHLPLEE